MLLLRCGPVGDVEIGPGNLAGRGVYAARDFAAGEVVVAYQLRPLDEAEYDALPPGEDLFVHSFGGRRYLYPAPASFVNHSDDPSCYQDFDRQCDIARRRIARGEPITIDVQAETARELETFLEAFRQAMDARSQELLEALVDRDATLWAPGGAVRRREAVVARLLELDVMSISDIEWMVGTGRWEAACSAQGLTTAGDQEHHTLLLKVVKGNWQIIYHHAG